MFVCKHVLEKWKRYAWKCCAYELNPPQYLLFIKFSEKKSYVFWNQEVNSKDIW